MSLWGTNDTIYSTGTIKKIEIDSTTSDATVTGNDDVIWNTTNSPIGSVITFGNDDGTDAGKDSPKGSGVIKSITSTTVVVLNGSAGITALSANALHKYNISEQPTYLPEDSNYGGNEIYGVDTTEQGVVSAASGKAHQYAPPHAGWVGIQTYVDAHGNYRVKTETLVASSSISNDTSVDNWALPQS